MTSIKNVIDGGYCVGCGNCAFLTKGKMKINEYGEYIPDIELKNNYKDEIDRSCPSLHPEINEYEISNKLYSKNCSYNNQLGYYNQLYAAHVLEGDYRKNGSSGGMGTWILHELLKQKLIDGVILVAKKEKRQDEEPFFEYKISKNFDEIKNASKSKYHVVEFSKILNLIQNKNEKYAFIGIPCMCKSIRRIQLINKEFSLKIPYIISLICGHLKSINWTLSLAWGAGIEPYKLNTLDYRTKSKDINPRSYILKLQPKDNKTKFVNSKKVAGGKFNSGAMMLNACNYCDDVVGETSDLTIGDAWLDKYKKENMGKNLVITRNSTINKIIKDAEKEKRISLDQISVKEAIESQIGCFNQRRQGLSYRLKIKEEKNEWVPKKRISSNDFKPNILRKLIFQTRMEISNKSRKLFVKSLKQNNYEIYRKTLSKILFKLRFLEVLNRIIVKVAKKL